MGNWSELPKYLLELILERLSFIDVTRAKLVCTNWLTMVNGYISSSSYANMRRSAVLMIPPELKGDDESGNYFSFFCLGDKKVYKFRNLPEEVQDGLCVGSSHGWLILLDKNLELCLFNPFSKVKVLVSSLRTFPNIHNVKFRPPSSYGIYIYEEYKCCVSLSSAHSAREIQGSFIKKAILSSDPLDPDNKFGLLVIHSVGLLDMESELAFYNSRIDQWKKLDRPTYGGYHDIIYHNGRFYALQNGESGRIVEVWDYCGEFPVKIKELQVDVEQREESLSLPSACYTQRYIVESQGEILLVTRYIASYFTYDNTDSDLNDDEIGAQGTSEKYKTFLFHLDRLEFDQNKCVEVESLDGRAIFLGKNHSQSLLIQEIPECEENSIYFTDHWDFNYFYDGHDIGIYDFEAKTVKPCISGQFVNSESPVYWFFPSLQ